MPYATNPLDGVRSYFEHGLIFADHRGHGRSDKPHDVEAHALPIRAAAEIPHCRLLTLHGHTHLSAPDEVGQVLPAVREVLALGNRPAG